MRGSWLILALAVGCGGSETPRVSVSDCDPCPETVPQIVGGLLYCQCVSPTTKYDFSVAFPHASASVAACPTWTEQWSRFAAENCH